MELVIVTGMSGAGRSTAMKYLEDLGFYCTDNLPAALLHQLLDLTAAGPVERQRLAVGIDSRNWESVEAIPQTLQEITDAGYRYRILYLDADAGVLVKRYKETRRTHPLAGDDRVDIGIARDRQRMRYLKEHADYIIDTSRLLTRELKSELQNIFIDNQEFRSMMVTVLSFGFKYGIPSDADLVMDVRFLPNPYYVPELRPMTGNDREIQEYVLNCPEAEEFLERFGGLVRFLIPNYISEGKNQLVIAIGCTGGKHRSVTMANEIYRILSGGQGYGLKLEHRDILVDR